MKKFIFLLLIILSISSCATREEIVYFQNLEKLDEMAPIQPFEPRIEVNDVLQITVSSFNPESAAPFNLNYSSQSLSSGSSSLGGSSGGSRSSRGGNALTGYMVETDGTIKFPVLGKISVINKTRRELEEDLGQRLQEYVTDAVVRVRIQNFKVTVMGETGSSVIQVPDEQVSILEVIAMAGDITYEGKRENVLIIRNHNGELSYGRVDLTDVDVFQSPFFYLKQNDIVYVEPTYRQVKSAGFIQDYSGFLSIITSVLSLFFIFTR